MDRSFCVSCNLQGRLSWGWWLSGDATLCICASEVLPVLGVQGVLPQSGTLRLCSISRTPCSFLPFSILFKLSSPNQLLQQSKHRLVINLHRWALFEQAGVHQPQTRVQQGAGVGAPRHTLPQAFPMSRRFLESPDILTSAWSCRWVQDIWFCHERWEKIGFVVVKP